MIFSSSGEKTKEKNINCLGPILCDIISRSIAKRWRAANRCSAVSITLSSLLLNTEKTKTAFLNSKKKNFQFRMMKVKKEDGREDYFSKVYDLKEELGKGTVFLFN